jgi:hypothetical protein
MLILRALLLAALAAAVPSAIAASASASTSGFQVTVRQGTDQGQDVPSWRGLYRAEGGTRFSTTDPPQQVKCSNSLKLERAVKQRRRIGGRWRILTVWVLIGAGRPTGFCAFRTVNGVGGVGTEFIHSSGAYLRLLRTTPLRLVYRVDIRVRGALVFRRRVIQPVTAASIARPFPPSSR